MQKRAAPAAVLFAEYQQQAKCRRLDIYDITASIGEGGMGPVERLPDSGYYEPHEPVFHD